MCHNVCVFVIAKLHTPTKPNLKQYALDQSGH